MFRALNGAAVVRGEQATLGVVIKVAVLAQAEDAILLCMVEAECGRDRDVEAPRKPGHRDDDARVCCGE